ncbi:MAG: hypothetical protein JNM78_18950 [Cyclobacteriaceae bacterium]|nr:hypothetical protein [Cyclobacteriaceae bacterium]
MKKPILIFLLFCCVFPLSAQDEDAIKSVISQETSSFMNVDYKSWADTWLKVPYAYRSYSDATITTYTEGWEELNKTFATYFKTALPANSEITNDWLEIKIFGNGAYVHFTQKIKDNIDIEETSQIRVLEKKDGKWKIVCLGAIAKSEAIN